MYLKSLVLRGFKSFADKSTLVLEPGITAIVGPNGSGKSNISDAVLWVLGERNARNLRGQAMEDVIFAGSSTRKPVNMAEVQLILDNSDGTLPVDYTEVSIGRRMYRSGESEYLINGVQARRMDVLEILHDSGLGTGTHSIISQGHLDSILESKPEDRRALIEEAAGVLKHKQRKAKSERKLERMNQHLTRVRDITDEVERQIKPLERKAKRAVAYKELNAQLSKLSLQLAVDDLRSLQAQWEDVLAREKTLRESISQLNDISFAADSKVREIQRSIAEQAEGSQKTEHSFHAMRNTSERIEATLRVLREKKRFVLRSREEKTRELDENVLRVSELEGELAEALDQEAEISKELKASEDSLVAKRTVWEKLKEQVETSDRQIRVLESEERALEAKLAVLREKQMRMSQAYQEGLAGSKLAEDKRSSMLERIAGVKEQAEEAARLLEASDAALSELSDRESRSRAATAGAMDVLEGAREEAARAREHKAVLDAQVSGFETKEAQRHAGNAVRQWAESELGDKDAWHDLVSVIDVPTELSDVVELLLGDAVDAMLVDSADDLRALLSGAGESSLSGSLHLAFAKGFECDSALNRPSLEGLSRLLDRLSFPAKMRGALEALLGNVYLVASALEALELQDRHVGEGLRFATCSGLVVEPTGVCVYRGREQGSIGAVEQHQQLVEARGSSLAAGQALDACLKRVASAEEKLRSAQKESLDLAGSLASAKGENRSLADQKRARDVEVSQLERQMADLERRHREAQEALERLKPDRDMVERNLQQAVDDLAAAKASLAQLRENAIPLRQEAQEASSLHGEAKLSCATLKERATYASRVVQGRRVNLDTAQARIVRLRRYLETSSQIPAHIDELLDVFESLHSSLMGWIGRLDARIQDARDKAINANRQLDDARGESRRLHGQLDSLNDQMSDIRVEKGRLEVQVENATSAIVKDRDIPLEVALAAEPVSDREQVLEQVEKLRRRIANMGTINPDAAEEYELLKERYDFLVSQVEDMQSARKSLEKIVRIIDDRMKRDFIDTFEQVNKRFKTIFADLFPGGSATLLLCDEDDLEHTGIDIEAQPLGKKVAKTSLMSGGEKSLIAMALLMAVYQTRSTPFYILDEVEAALDDTNLRRLCSCLDTMRQDTQLLIITHQRRTMEMADVLYGISMQGGSTKLVSQRLDREKIGKGE